MVLLTTGDAGSSWTTSSAANTAVARQVLFADTTNGWLVGDGGLQSTHDGGASWSTVDLPGGLRGGAIAAAGGAVHVAYLVSNGGAVDIVSSPVDRDAFVQAPVTIPGGAGPVFDVSMSAGGSHAEVVYNDRVFQGAAEISDDGNWEAWDLACPNDSPLVKAGLSPDGDALAIACSPSGFGDDAPLVAANLSSGELDWTEVVPAGDVARGETIARFATATDTGMRIVAFEKPGGGAEIASSSDAGATWSARYDLAGGTVPNAFTHLPDGRVLVATDPSGGITSADGVTWSPVETIPG